MRFALTNLQIETDSFEIIIPPEKCATDDQRAENDSDIQCDYAFDLPTLNTQQNLKLNYWPKSITIQSLTGEALLYSNSILSWCGRSVGWSIGSMIAR